MLAFILAVVRRRLGRRLLGDDRRPVDHGGADDDHTRRHTPATTTAAATTTPAVTGPAGLKTIDPAALQALVDATVQELGVPGAVVLLRTPQGEVVAPYGTTELGTRRPPRADTHFRIASITKTMTSAVILQLAQEGKLSSTIRCRSTSPRSPTATASRSPSCWRCAAVCTASPTPPRSRRRMDDDPTRVWTPQELLAIAFAQPPMFAPGAEYYYSNTNYVLLGLIIEQLDGRPLAASFEERLFEPLGMTDTMFPAPDSNAIPEPYSHGYLYGSSSHVMLGTPPYTPEMEAAARAGTLQPTDYTDINHSFAFAAGAVISTAADLATWMEALAGGKVLDAEYQRLWQDSAQDHRPQQLLQLVRVRHRPAPLGTQHDRPPRRPDPRIQLGGGLRPRQRHDARHVGQPDHVARQQVHGPGAHGEGAGSDLRPVTAAADHDHHHPA